MSQAGLFAEVVFVCFVLGGYVGRFLEEKRHGKIRLDDSDKLSLSIFSGALVHVIEQAAKAGWLPDGAQVAQVVAWGYLPVGAVSLYFISRLLRQSRGQAV